jgi:16S rRNA (guanine527-N7)-methyltransferase
MFHVEHASRWSDILAAGTSELGLILSDHVTAQLIVYARELSVWNQKVNLTAIRDEQGIIVKHFLDSLACTRALRSIENASLLDIGAGAGFPGLPLKILHPELDLTLLEPHSKKTAFLRYVIGTLGLTRATVISKRIEEYACERDVQHRFAFAVTRALRIDYFLSSIRQLLSPGGCLILCRSKPLEACKDLFGLQIRDQISYRLPYGYGERVLSILEVELTS